MILIIISVIFLGIIFYHFVNCVESISIIFCLGIVNAQKYKIISNQVNIFGIIVLITLCLLQGTIITLITGNQILYLATSLSMYYGAIKSWRINKFDTIATQNDEDQ